MKKVIVFITGLFPALSFGQWTFQKVDNGFDEPYKIAYTARNNDAILKLEPVEVEVELPKKYPKQAGMYYFETDYSHSITGGETIDLTTGSLRNLARVFSGEKLVIVGQTSIEINGLSKKYYMMFDRWKKVFCEQDQIKFTIVDTIQTFDIHNQNEIDSLIEIAKIYSEKCISVPQLVEKQIQVSFYISGGYFCDEDISVDISYLVGSEFQKYTVKGSKSKDNTTVFLIDDLNQSIMKEAFLKASMVKLRINESYCEKEYYEFKMTGSKAALDFILKQ